MHGKGLGNLFGDVKRVATVFAVDRSASIRMPALLAIHRAAFLRGISSNHARTPDVARRINDPTPQTNGQIP